MLTIRGQLRGAFHERGLGRVATTAPSAGRGSLQPRGDLLVAPDRRERKMPGLSVVVTRAVEGRGEGLMHVTEPGTRRAVVHRGANQRMAELHARGGHDEV